jgi:hypothetical protein
VRTEPHRLGGLFSVTAAAYDTAGISIVAAVGDFTRFDSPDKLNWARRPSSRKDSRVRGSGPCCHGGASAASSATSSAGPWRVNWARMSSGPVTISTRRG